MENLKVLKLNFENTSRKEIIFDGEFTYKTRNLEIFDVKLKKYITYHIGAYLYFFDNSLKNWGNLKELNLVFKDC